MPKTGTKTKIEWDVLRPRLAKLKKAELLEVLGLAFNALPKTQLAQVFGAHVDLDALTAKPRRSMSAGRLLQTVQQFHRDSLKGKYYEGFNVNSKNYREKSEGTKTWMKEVDQLFSQCVAVSDMGGHREAREAMDLLFDLLFRIDDGETFIFFADEQAAWQVQVDYKQVFPAYFTSLAVTIDPDEYMDRVSEVIKFESWRKDEHLRSARRAARKARRQ